MINKFVILEILYLIRLLVNRNRNIMRQAYCIKQKDREHLHKHRSILLWFTGLSGSGKSTIANALEEKLYHRSISTYVLDGDNIRHGLCKDLTFNINDRYENLRRVGEVSRLLIDAGLVVLATFISPYKSGRQMVRNMFPHGTFIEIFVDTPMQVCAYRDPKGLYQKVKLGKVRNFTGIDVPYEKPDNPEIYLDGQKRVSELVGQVLDKVNIKFFGISNI